VPGSTAAPERTGSSARSRRRSPRPRAHPRARAGQALHDQQTSIQVTATRPTVEQEVSPQLSTFTARATTSTTTASATADCTIMIIFDHLDSGITSVGLNAVELVNDR
jgi:hypothetical protein